MATRERAYPGHSHSSELVALGAPVTAVPLTQIATGFWAFKTSRATTCPYPLSPRADRSHRSS